MCAAKIDGVEEVPSRSESTLPSPPSTIVAVVPSQAAESLVSILSRTSNGITASAETAESEFIDASDLTREQWMRVLYDPSGLTTTRLTANRSASSVLKAWKQGSDGGNTHFNRAPCAGSAPLPSSARAYRVLLSSVTQDGVAGQSTRRYQFTLPARV